MDARGSKACYEDFWRGADHPHPFPTVLPMIVIVFPSLSLSSSYSSLSVPHGEAPHAGAHPTLATICYCTILTFNLLRLFPVLGLLYLLCSTRIPILFPH